MKKIKIYQLPYLIHVHVDLDVHLFPQDGLESPTKFGFLERFEYKHVYCGMYYKSYKMTDLFIQNIILVLYLAYFILMLFTIYRNLSS